MDRCLTGWPLYRDIQEILEAAISDLKATIFLQLLKGKMSKMRHKAIAHKLIFYLHGHPLALLISTFLIDFPPSLCLLLQPRSLPSLKMQHPSPPPLSISPTVLPSFPPPPSHSSDSRPILSISSVSHTFLYISATSFSRPPLSTHIDAWLHIPHIPLQPPHLPPCPLLSCSFYLSL